jgi:hypothetical protein
LKVGLNSTNQQLYNLALTLSGESVSSEIAENDISTEPIDNQPRPDINDDVTESYEEDDPFDDTDEPEPNEEQEEGLKSDEIDRLPEKQKGYFKQLEEQRSALKRESMKKGRQTKINDEKIQRDILEQKRIEARAKLKAEEILVKKHVQENKNKNTSIPDEIRKEFEEKYGRF